MPGAGGSAPGYDQQRSSGVEPFRFNAVLCNPLFVIADDNVAWNVLCRRCLKINGRLYRYSHLVLP